MTHVYFHCASADQVFIDRHGVEVEDLVEAHQYAARMIQRLVNSVGLDDWRSWTLHVNDEDGEELFLMPFAYVLGRPH
jgi:hypothetical protein